MLEWLRQAESDLSTDAEDYEHYATEEDVPYMQAISAKLPRCYHTIGASPGCYPSPLPRQQPSSPAAGVLFAVGAEGMSMGRPQSGHRGSRKGSKSNMQVSWQKIMKRTPDVPSCNKPYEGLDEDLFAALQPRSSDDIFFTL